MTLRSARAQLATEMEYLWSMVGDLVLITIEDQPEGQAPAAFDDLVNEVSEIQADVAAVRTAVRESSEQELEVRLAEAAEQLDVARTRYWRCFRAYEKAGTHRAAARRVGRQWPAWWDSVNKSAQACDGPFDAATAAMYLCWQEVCQLVTQMQTPSQAAAGRTSQESRRMS